MRYQDSSYPQRYPQRPPWDYTDPPLVQFQPSEFEPSEFQRGDFQPDEFQRELHHDGPPRRRGDADTSVDLFSPADHATIDGQQYGVTPGYEDDEPAGPRRYARVRQGKGLLAGGTAGFLAAALALGVANLAAAFVRPQASPIIAVGGAFIDRTPPWLKNFAVEKFGENDKTMLLLGLYVTIAFIAIAVGVLAWRRLAAGIVGIGAFGAFGAFVAYTRPESLPTDMIPSLAGGVAGIAAIIGLTRWTRRRVRTARSEWVA